jgi:hypothetical protein
VLSLSTEHSQTVTFICSTKKEENEIRVRLGIPINVILWIRFKSDWGSSFHIIHPMGIPHQPRTLTHRHHCHQHVSCQKHGNFVFANKGSNFSWQTNMVCLSSYSKNAGKISQKVDPTHTSSQIVKCCSSNKTWRNPGTGDEERLTSVISWVTCELDYPGSRWAPQWDFRDARKEHINFHRLNRDFSPIQVSTQRTAPDSGAGQPAAVRGVNL